MIINNLNECGERRWIKAHIKLWNQFQIEHIVKDKCSVETAIKPSNNKSKDYSHSLSVYYVPGTWKISNSVFQCPFQVGNYCLQYTDCFKCGLIDLNHLLKIS